MKCKKCKREIAENSLFCNWCGHKQLTPKGETRVPSPSRTANGKYTAQLMVKGNRVRVTADSEKEYYAKARATKEGLVEAMKPDNRIVRDMVDAYIASRDGIISVTTIDGYKRKATHNLQMLFPLRIKDLTLDTVQTAINADAKKYAGKTIWSAWALIKAATGVELPGLVLPSKKPKKIPPTYSVAEIQNIIVELSKIGGQIECAGLLAMWLSLRRSEIMGLRWEDIGEDCIHVRKAKVYNEKHQLVEKDTKTALSERTIPCDDYILSRLNALPHTSANVFTMSTAGIHDGITRVCEAAKVPHGYLHGFRHTNATVMEYLGVPALYANKRGGWANDHIRQTTYATTMSEGDRQAAEKVDAFFTALAE